MRRRGRGRDGARVRESTRGSTTGERRAGVEPRAPTELKERSSTRKLPSASGAGVFGVAVGALVERGESAKRLGRVGVECMARLMFSARSTVLGESGIMSGLKRGGEERDSVLVRQGRVLLVDVKHAGLLR